MKDVLKIMRFDFLTAKPLTLGAFIIVTAVCFLLGLFFSPLICSYITFGAILFVIPLHGVADKNGFNKLYGILPVQLKNITRSRFLYIFLLYLFSEILETILAIISKSLKLYRVLPNQNSAGMQMVAESFENTTLIYIAIIGVFTFFCLMFSYMEMMGQIFGRENEMKIILITLGVISAVILGLSALSERGILPALKLPKIPETTAGKVMVGAVLNIIVLGICMLFGEITANKLAKREL